MWRTSEGDRSLTNKEAELVLASVAYLRDMLTSAIELDVPHITEVAVFDALQPSQQLASLHEVAFALVDTETPVPALTAIREATVYVIFRELVALVEIEIDWSSAEKMPHHELRSLILGLAKEEFIPDQDESSDDLDEEAFKQSLTWQDSEHQLMEESFDETLPGLDCDEIDRWSELLDELSDRVLWDRDFETEGLVADDVPELANQFKATMGIEPDYFAAPAFDPTPEEIYQLDQELVRLTASSRPIFAE